MKMLRVSTYCSSKVHTLAIDILIVNRSTKVIFYLNTTLACMFMKNKLSKKQDAVGVHQLDMGRVHPWVGLGRVGSGWVGLQNFTYCVGWVGSGNCPVSKICNKYTLNKKRNRLFDDYNS